MFEFVTQWIQRRAGGNHRRSKPLFADLPRTQPSDRIIRIFEDPEVERRGPVRLFSPEEKVEPFTHAALETAIAKQRGVLTRAETPGAQSWETKNIPAYRTKLTYLEGLRIAERVFPTRDFRTGLRTGGPGNGLLSVALHAYAEHQGMVLAPEAFLLTIMQGVARFVFREDEAHIRPEDREVLETMILVGTGQLAPRASASGLAAAVRTSLLERDEFATRVATAAPLLATDPQYASARDVVLLAAFQARYQYHATMVACGLRKVVIEGAPTEWATVAAAIGTLGELPELAALIPWLTTVREISARIGAFDASDPASSAFMRRMVQYEPPCCSSGKVSGWVADLFPFYHGELRTEFPTDGSPEMFELYDKGIDDHLVSEATIHVTLEGCGDSAPEFDVKLQAGLEVREELDGDLVLVRPVPFTGIWAYDGRWDVN